MVGATELVVILFIIGLLWGPERLPSLARALGEVMREYKLAVEGIGISEKAPPPREGDDILVNTAVMMGIQTSGKTLEQIGEEIVKTSQKRKESRGSTPSEDS